MMQYKVYTYSTYLFIGELRPLTTPQVHAILHRIPQSCLPRGCRSVNRHHGSESGSKGTTLFLSIDPLAN